MRVRQPTRHIAIAALEKSLDHYTEMEIKALQAMLPEPDEESATQPDAETQNQAQAAAVHPWAPAPTRTPAVPLPATSYAMPESIPFRSRAAQLLFGNRPSEDGVPRTMRR